MKPFLIIFICLFILAVEAQQCKRNFRLDAPGGPLDGSPVLDQGNLDICNQNAVCKTVDAARFYLNGSKKIPFDCSPIALSIEVAQEKNYGDLEGWARPQDVFEVAKTNGTCSNEKIRKKFSSNVQRNYCDEVKTALRGIIQNNISELRNSGMSCNLGQGDSQNPMRATTILAKALNVEASIANLKSEIGKVCKAPDAEKFIGMPDIKREAAFSTPNLKERLAKLKDTIDNQLDSPKPMPIAFSYCFSVMLKKESIGVDPILGKTSSKICQIEGSPAQHASVIIGRRTGPRGCQYLVMNSHGTSCNQYDKAWDCEGGKIWVDEENLLRNTSALYFAELP
jgi:hypothetical protein